MTDKELAGIKGRYDSRVWEKFTYYNSRVNEEEVLALLDRIASQAQQIEFQQGLIHDLVAEKFDVGNLQAIYKAMDDAEKDRFWDAVLRLPLKGTVVRIEGEGCTEQRFVDCSISLLPSGEPTSISERR